MNKADPTKASLKLVLDGDNGDDFANPDNMDTARGKVVFQEDRESAFRDIYSRVLVYDIKTGTLTPVARVDTPGHAAARHLGVVRRRERRAHPGPRLVVHGRAGTQHVHVTAGSDAGAGQLERRGRPAPGRLHPADDRGEGHEGEEARSPLSPTPPSPPNERQR